MNIFTYAVRHKASNEIYGYFTTRKFAEESIEVSYRFVPERKDEVEVVAIENKSCVDHL